MKVLNKIEKILFSLLVIFYLAIIVVVSIQVICRVTPLKAPAWTEEASRYTMIYLIVFSTGFAIKEKAFIGVDTIFHFISEKKKLILQFINNLLLLIFALFLLRFSVDFYKLGQPQTSVSMPILHMNQIYFSMILLSFLLILYLAIEETKIFKQIKDLKKGAK